MESWVVDVDDCQFHLSSHAVADGYPTTLHLNFHYGPFSICYRPDFRTLQDPAFWSEEVLLMLQDVLQRSGGGGHSGLFGLVTWYCQYLNSVIQRIPANFGTSITVDALIIDAAHPASGGLPPLADDAMVLPEALVEIDLDVVVFGKGEAEKEYSGTTCSICIDDFEAGQQLLVMPCRHRFHEECLAEWLSRSAVCPLCRLDLYDLAVPPVN